MEGAHGLKAWLGLGSNVGDRMANLRAGCDALERDGVRVVARSHVYETEAMDGAVGQADFFNAVISVETELKADELLTAAKRIEVELGRDPGAPRHSARPLDIDLLMTDGEAVDVDHLQIPHASLTQRRFVLEPLLEVDPPEREGLERALAGVQDQRVERLPIIP